MILDSSSFLEIMRNRETLSIPQTTDNKLKCAHVI